MNRFKSSAELKASAREHMIGHYGTAMGATILMGLLIGLITMVAFLLTSPFGLVSMIIYQVIAFLISILAGLFTSGLTYLYLKLACGRPASVGDLFYGFRLCPDKALLIQGWITVITYLATLPQLVVSYRMSRILLQGNGLLYPEEAMELLLPLALTTILAEVVSVMLSLLYGQAFYLLHDFPQYSAVELLKKSRRLMVHHKGRFFYLLVSFLPMLLLGVLSSGLALLWVLPYMQATQTEFFLDLIKNNTEAA